ncbi:MAG: hypothetical protein C0511_09230 [Hyphomicrobium sp.]|nr:hypothetical protein [Hyphomicrobium sp.]
MRVAVYFNLHRRQFSVKALEGPDKGRVIMHRDFVALTDVTFRVREAGRQRVIREGRKNVHAFVIGTLGYDAEGWAAPAAIRYNPYRRGDFVDVLDTPVRAARVARLAIEHDRASIAACGLTYGE